jgi:peptidoglycan/LPS O-acetylase OafA/YrhL
VALFILGILIAENLEAIGNWYGGLTTLRKWLLLAAAFLSYNFTAIVAAVVLAGHTKLLTGISDWGTALGAVGIIVSVLYSRRINTLFRLPVPVFLGRISYSLYLVHIPVLLAMAFFLQRRFPLRAALMLPLYSIVALVVAYLFCILVEEPFTRLGRVLKSRRGDASGAPLLVKSEADTPFYGA